MIFQKPKARGSSQPLDTRPIRPHLAPSIGSILSRTMASAEVDGTQTASSGFQVTWSGDQSYGVVFYHILIYIYIYTCKHINSGMHEVSRNWWKRWTLASELHFHEPKNERLAIGTSKWCGGGPPGAPFFPALFATISPASKEVGHLMYHQPWQWHCHSEKSAVHNILIVCINIYI